MPACKSLKKDKAIKTEMERLEKIYLDIEPNRKSVIYGLIERAAFMRVTLGEMEQDIEKNGLTELFSQGNQEPYTRKRPVADLYNSMNAGYQKIIKLLSDQLPKQAQETEKDDGFDDFVSGRDD